MRIAVDARPLIAPKTGIGRYLTELLRRMPQQSNHQWFLYGAGPGWKTSVPLSDMHSTGRDAQGSVVVRTPNRADELHAQVMFPRWAALDRADVFWSPRHRLPIGLTTPAVVTIHDLVWKHAPATMKPLGYLVERATMPQSIRRARRLIAVSQATKCSIEHYFPEAANKTTVVHEASFTEAPEIPNAPAIRPFGLFVGTVEPRKNIERLLKAFASIKDEVAHDLHLVGGAGWRVPKPTALIRANGLESRVHHLGALEDQDLLRGIRRLRLRLPCRVSTRVSACRSSRQCHSADLCSLATPRRWRRLPATPACWSTRYPSRTLPGGSSA